MADQRGATKRVQTRDVVVGEGDARVETYVVDPAHGEATAGVIFLHWLGEHRSDRTQFLGEARELARLGVRSVLPAGRLPWLVPPTDAAADVEKLQVEARRLDAAFAELLSGLPTAAPIALVGHDFGGMHGLLLAARQPRVETVVFIAGVPRWADWFLPFWPIAGDPIDYRRALAPFDLTTAVAGSGARFLFQFSRRDFFIAPFMARELVRAAPTSPAEPRLEWYEADHAMRSSRARASRVAFLRERLLGR